MKRVSRSAGSGGFYLIGGHGAKHVLLHLSPCGRGRYSSRARISGEGSVSADAERAERNPSPGASRHLLPQGEKGKRAFSASTARPGRGYGKREPAQDQQRAAGGRGKRKQAVAGILPQRQVGREQRGRDDKSKRGGEPDPPMQETALGQGHDAEHGGGVKQQHRGSRRKPRGSGLMR